MGALDVTKVVDGGQGWRLLTCTWLHAGVVHLLLNMLSLALVGVRLEREFGPLRVGAVYLASGLGGSLMPGLFTRRSPPSGGGIVVSVGVSGALFGLVGSMLSELITNWSLYANKAAALASLLLVIAVNLALGVLPHVDNFAHIGGLASGFLLGFVVFVRPHFDWLDHQRSRVAVVAGGAGAGAPPPAATPTPAVAKRRKHRTYQHVLWVSAAVLLAAGFAAAAALLFRGYNANNHCSWCHYLSCVPTKRWRCGDWPSPPTTTWCVFNTSPTTVGSGGDNNTTAGSVVCQWGGGGGRNWTVPLPPPPRRAAGPARGTGRPLQAALHLVAFLCYSLCT